jgi:hypothetical protein
VQIRSQIAKEMIDDLKDVGEENALLMRESVSLAFSLDNVVEHPLSRRGSDEGPPDDGGGADP